MDIKPIASVSSTAYPDPRPALDNYRQRVRSGLRVSPLANGGTGIVGWRTVGGDALSGRFGSADPKLSPEQEARRPENFLTAPLSSDILRNSETRTAFMRVVLHGGHPSVCYVPEAPRGPGTRYRPGNGGSMGHFDSSTKGAQR